MPAPDLWKNPGHEPELADMLSDPIVRAVMRRDGLSMLDVLEPALAARAALSEQDSDQSFRTAA